MMWTSTLWDLLHKRCQGDRNRGRPWGASSHHLRILCSGLGSRGVTIVPSCCYHTTFISHCEPQVFRVRIISKLGFFTRAKGNWSFCSFSGTTTMAATLISQEPRGMANGRVYYVMVPEDIGDDGGWRSLPSGCVWKCRVPHCTQWLMIIIPIKWLFHWEYTLFSDKPIWGSKKDKKVKVRLNTCWKLCKTKSLMLGVAGLPFTLFIVKKCVGGFINFGSHDPMCILHVLESLFQNISE